MSGGSWDYAYSNIADIAERLTSDSTIKRRVLGKLVMLTSKALHDIEWVDSGDYSPGDDYDAIDACLKFKTNGAIKEDMNEYIKQLKEVCSK